MCLRMRLIHISDPHLTSLEGIASRHFVGKRRLGYASWRYRRRHRHLRSTLDELCARALALDPDVIVVTGDLVHLGLAAEIEEAANWLRTLGTPERVFVVPGNHDLYRPDSWAAVQAHWRDYLRLDALATTAKTATEATEATRVGEHCGPGPFADEEPAHWAGFPTRFAMDGVEVHGLNTGLPTPIFMASGELGEGQCDRLDERLSAATNRNLNVLAIHHPPAPAVVPRRASLNDIERLESAARNAHFIVHGHGHFNRCYRFGNLPVFATGSASKSDAPFRCFDFSRENHGWRVEMRLHTRTPNGFSITESRSLDFNDERPPNETVQTKQH